MELLDDDAMLSQAAAFLESWENFDTSDYLLGIDPSMNSLLAPIPTLKIRDAMAQDTHQRKNQRGYSTRLLKRKRDELQSLRGQEKELQEWLKRLKRGGSIVISPASGNSQEELKGEERQKLVETALEEFQKRRRSEMINDKLKAIQVDHAKLVDSLLETIQQESMPEDKAFVLASSRTPSCGYRLAGADKGMPIVAQLLENTELLFLQSTTMVPASLEPSYSSVMKPKFDATRGKMFEISVASDVQCSMSAASDILWREVIAPPQHGLQSARNITSDGPNISIKSFDLMMNYQQGPVCVNGLTAARRYEEAGRVVIVRTFVIFLPAPGVFIRCYHWAIVAVSNVDAQNACRVQVFAQIFLEEKQEVPTSADLAYVQNFTLPSYSLKLYLYSQQLVDIVSNHAGDIAMI